ncbi:MAG: carboxypeptidase regulatory-like domain-containing protein [Holophagaceae bacterium]|nr:carboxypeptidase regulatory-like domain-containing protein [Holophagaceae bacterium]
MKQGLRLSLVLTLLIVPATSWAQTGTPGSLSGRVVNQKGIPVKGAKVVLRHLGEPPQERVVLSDGLGQWRAPLLPLGEWRVQISHQDYSTVALMRKIGGGPYRFEPSPRPIAARVVVLSPSKGK